MYIQIDLETEKKTGRNTRQLLGFGNLGIWGFGHRFQRRWRYSNANIKPNTIPFPNNIRILIETPTTSFIHAKTKHNTTIPIPRENPTSSKLHPEITTFNSHPKTRQHCTLLDYGLAYGQCWAFKMEIGTVLIENWTMTFCVPLWITDWMLLDHHRRDWTLLNFRYETKLSLALKMKIGQQSIFTFVTKHHLISNLKSNNIDTAGQMFFRDWMMSGFSPWRSDVVWFSLRLPGFEWRLGVVWVEIGCCLYLNGDWMLVLAGDLDNQSWTLGIEDPKLSKCRSDVSKVVWSWVFYRRMKDVRSVFIVTSWRIE